MTAAAASHASCVAVVHTAAAPGAIALIELIGGVDPVLSALTDRADWPRERPVLANLAGVDYGIIVRLRPDVAYVMPHGGPRVVERLLAALARCGAPAAPEASVDPRELFPAARDRCEALALVALSGAASPLAIDLLLAQPARWRDEPTLTQADETRTARLNRLLVPPLVVLAGPPNVGKSTLSNRLFGRRVSIAYDRPGTTRDYTAGLIDLAGLVVRWHDTPGLDDTDDPIEQRAIEIASDLLKRADYVIAITDADHDWPKLDRTADLRVAARTDIATRDDADLPTSGKTGEGIEALVETVRDALVPPEDRSHSGPWRFDARL